MVRETIEVLDERVTVELTPVKYRWRHGDGEARTSRTAGKMLPTRADVWEKETPTSHMYLKRGGHRHGLSAQPRFGARFLRKRQQ